MDCNMVFKRLHGSHQRCGRSKRYESALLPLAAPLHACDTIVLTPLPIGVQIIAAPWREDVALRIAHALEQAGAVAATRPSFAPDKRARTRTRK